MAIVLRMNKGSALSFAEVDGNFTDINTRTVTLETNKSNWDTAYSWGDHNAQTYLNNTDMTTNAPTNGQYLQWNGTKWIPAAVTATNFDGSPAASVSTSLINNWNTAFSWGDHSVAGYSTFNGNYSNLTNKPSIPSTLLNLSINDGTSGQVLTTNGSGTFSFTDKTPNQNLFSTIAVNGQSNVVADADTDTLTFVAGNNITITTDSNSDSITIASSAATQNVFDKIAVSGQSNIEADSTTDTLTLIAGANMTISTDVNNDSVTFASSGTTQNLFDKIAVSGQSNVEADSATDTLTLVAGNNITITTDANNDSVTFASSAATQNVFDKIAVSGQSNIEADSTTDTLTLIAGANMTISTDVNNDSVTFASSGTTQNLFDKIAVSGQSNVEADSATDTLTLVAGANMTISTDVNNDSVTFASSQNLFDKIAVSGQSNVEADSATDTLTLIAGANMTITTDAAGDSVTFASAPAFARTTAAGTTSSIANGAADNISVTVFKSYYLLKIQTSAAAWVTVYTDIVSRTLDASRTETTDPLPGQGIIAEVITTGAQTIKITPGVFGFNNESTVSSSIPIKVVNKSGSTAAITVTMTVVQVEG